jgi:hypothetical protein
MGAASSFAEAEKFACREWAIGYTSGFEFSDRGLPFAGKAIPTLG